MCSNYSFLALPVCKRFPPPDSQTELVQLQPVFSSILLSDTEFLLPVLSIFGSPLFECGNLHTDPVQLLLSADGSSISILVNEDSLCLWLQMMHEHAEALRSYCLHFIPTAICKCWDVRGIKIIIMIYNQLINWVINQQVVIIIHIIRETDYRNRKVSVLQKTLIVVYIYIFFSWLQAFNNTDFPFLKAFMQLSSPTCCSHIQNTMNQLKHCINVKSHWYNRKNKNECLLTRIALKILKNSRKHYFFITVFISATDLI